ncbi:MAG: flagellinolysin [Selenomonadaceae bacterium]|nr:flagellinolysin [Selenomonadaceae bacterium]
MSLTVKNNMPALCINNQLDKNSNTLSKNLNKVASGLRITGAGDDASGYAISENMRVQIRALDQDVRNAQNGQSLLRTAEGAVQSIVDILRTLKERAINAANDTNTDADRAIIQKEVNAFIEQIDDNAHVTYNGKYLLNHATPFTDLTETTAVYEYDSLSEAAKATEDDDSPEAHIIRALNSEWFQSCLDLIGTSYGMSFDEAGTYVNDIEVNFSNEGGNTLAYVTNWSYTSGPNVGEATKLALTINMDFYDQIDKTDLSGYTNASAGYLDRTLAHELVHAVMAANIKNFNSLPKYIKEGTAELVHGIDDFRYSTILQYAMKNQATNVQNALANPENYESGSSAYAIGYTLLHYMAKQGSAQTGNSQLNTIKTFMSTLDNHATGGMDAYNQAVYDCTGGKYANSAALVNAYVTDLTNYGGTDTNSAIDFLKNYCGVIMNNDDTGSVTGSDMGGSGSDTKTAESVVPETGPISSWTLPTTPQTTFVGGLTAIWPEAYVNDGTDSSDSSGADSVGVKITYVTTKVADMPNPMHLQVGTKANQTIALNFSDMRAKALGLVDDDNNYVSLATREAANAAISVFEDAIEYALDEQTNIGAKQNRLEFTVANLTTAAENTQSAESVIRDADMAKEMSEYTKTNVLLQASQSMLAQANQSGSSVLSLLQ